MGNRRGRTRTLSCITGLCWLRFSSGEPRTRRGPTPDRFLVDMTEESKYHKSASSWYQAQYFPPNRKLNLCPRTKSSRVGRTNAPDIQGGTIIERIITMESDLLKEVLFALIRSSVSEFETQQTIIKAIDSLKREVVTAQPLYTSIIAELSRGIMDETVEQDFIRVAYRALNSNKISVIKLMREMYAQSKTGHLGLKEAKDKADAALKGVEKPYEYACIATPV
jgi:ribosomal protein L7/L12